MACSRSEAHAAVRIRYLQHSHGDSTVLHWRPGQSVEDRQMSEVMWKDDSGLGGGRVGRGEGEFRGWIDKGEEEEKMGVICYTLVSGIEKSECCSEV